MVEKQKRVHLADPVTLDFVVVVVSLHNLDTVLQTFQASLILRAWTKGLSKARSVLGEDADNWSPRIRLLNLIGTDKWCCHKKPHGDGELEMKWTITGTFTERMELSAFPRDRQDFNFLISSAMPRFNLGDRAPREGPEREAMLRRLDRHTQLTQELSSVPQPAESAKRRLQEELRGEEEWLQGQLDSGALRNILTLRPKPGARSILHTRNFAMSSIFKISTAVRVYAYWSSSEDATNGSMPSPLLQASASLSRQPGYFFYNVELLTFLLTAFGGASFHVGESVSNRLGVTLTLVLTAVAFKLVIAADMPKVSYQTAIDKFVLACFVVLALVVVENSLCWHPVVQENGLLIHVSWWFLVLTLGLGYAVACCWYGRCQAQEEREHEALAAPWRADEPGHSEEVSQAMESRVPLLAD